MARAARRNLHRKTWWLPRALFLMFLLPALPLPFPRSLPQGSLLCFSLACTRPARSPCGYYLAQGGALGAKAWSPAEAPSLPHSLPVKSSGAIWMGVPTMLPDIMASGLQNPKSVILARSCLSSCQQSRARVSLRRSLHAAPTCTLELRAGVSLHGALTQASLSPDSFPLLSSPQTASNLMAAAVFFNSVCLTLSVGPGTWQTLSKSGKNE